MAHLESFVVVLGLGRVTISPPPALPVDKAMLTPLLPRKQARGARVVSHAPAIISASTVVVALIQGYAFQRSCIIVNHVILGNSKA